MKLSTTKIVQTLTESYIKEADKWAKDVKPEKGKMHKVLGIPEDDKIEDHYSSGKDLASALVKAVKGDKKKAAGMLAFAANVKGGTRDIFDKALVALKTI